MSWNGLKKAINRAGTQVMVKAGQIDETIDKQYEFEEKRFKLMETNSIRLHKELRHYLDSLRVLTMAQTNIAEVLNGFYGDDETNDANGSVNGSANNFSREYFNVMKQLNETSLSNLEGPYNQVILNPIARFNSYFSEINEAMKKRANKKLDYDAMKNKLHKLVEKPGNTNEYETKLSQQRDELVKTKELYNALNDNLKDELPKLINLRIPFLNPSFESYIKLQLRFFNDNYNSLNNLQSKLDSGLRQDYISGNLEGRLDDVLVRMRELNITGK